MKPKSSKSPSQQPQSPTSSRTSEIDLRNLTLAELHQLKQQLEELLATPPVVLKDTDIILEYDVKIRTKDGIVSQNVGSTRMNAILNPRLLAGAPARFEHDFNQQVFSPVYADMFELMESSNPTSNSLEPIRTVQSNYNEQPTWESPSMHFPALPGE